MIDHTAVNVTDLNAAKAYYSKALEPLGYSLAFEVGDFLGFADANGMDLGVVRRDPVGGAHVAFKCDDHAAVDAYHAAAMAAGGKDNGPPEIRELVRTLARERIAPRAAEIDASHEFPWDVVELYREQEIFGLFFDEAHGGTGTGTLLSLVAIEEVSKVCATSGLILAVQELGSLGLKVAGTDEQKSRCLPKLASGEWLVAYALTEAGSGSDSAAMRTAAHRDGDEYVLDGSKRFITNAGVANLYTVFAKTDPEAGHAGISAFVVESDTPGFEVARLEPKMGIAGSTTGELVFENCRIPAANLLGEEGEGFKIAMRILDRSRPGVAAQALGIAQGATDYALEYARTRETMGKPIVQHQLIAGKLADMETRCEAARGLLYRF